MRQKIRRSFALLALLVFPLTLNYFSPYVSIDGAMVGVISGSVIVFILLFLSGIVLGRAWCGWLCPMAGLSEMTLQINNKNVNIKNLRRVRLSIFAVWASILVLGFVLAGGIKGVNPLHLTENIISVDAPVKYIIYYSVLLIFTVLSIVLGKRGACQSICWMSPFLAAGYHVGKGLKIPQLRIVSQKDRCVSCGICDKKCPMSLPVSTMLKTDKMSTSDCILCGECVDHCKKNVLSYRFTVVK